MQDLSVLAKDSMWPTSQAAGNRQSKPDTAMTAPGSSPVDRELDTAQMADPHVEVGSAIPTGTSGKPRVRAGGMSQPRPAWTKTSTPQVVREN